MSTRYVWDVSQKTNSYTSELYDFHYHVSDDTRLTFSKSYDFDKSTGLYSETSDGTSYTPSSVSSGQVVLSTSSLGYYFARDGFYNTSSVFQAPSQGNWYIFRSSNGQVTVNLIPTGDTGPAQIREYRGTSSGSSSSTHIKYVSGNSRSSYSDGLGSDGYTYTYQGSDTIDPSSVTYSTNSPTSGSSITIRATTRTPTYGGTIYYQFSYSIDGGSSWTDIGSESTTASASVTVPSGATQFRGRVVASDSWGFTSTTYVTGNNLTVSTPVTNYTVSLFVSPTGGGTVSGDGTYESGSSVTVRATANSGYNFSYWHKNGSSVSTSQSYSFSITENTSLIAVFASDGSGSGEPTGNGKTYVGISDVARKVSKIYVGVNNRARKVLKGYIGIDGKARLFFTQLPKYILSLLAEPSNGGTVYGSGTYESGKTVTATASASSGYIFSEWVKDGSSVSKSSSYSFKIQENTNLIGKFRKALSDWTTFYLPSGVFCYDIKYTNNRFIVSPAENRADVTGAYSLDGENWVTTTFPTGEEQAPAYGNGKYVFFDNSGLAYYSSDLLSWTETTSGLSGNSVVENTVFGNGKFVATPYGNYVVYSSNGANWGKGNVSNGTMEDSHKTVAYGDGKFLAVPTGSSYGGYYSTNGANWTEIYYNDGGYRTDISSGMAFGNGMFVGFSYNGKEIIYAYSSDMKLKALKSTVTSGSSWSSITYGNGIFLAISYSGKTIYSQNGLSWYAGPSLPSGDSWFSVSYGNGKFIAIEKGTNRAAYALA